MRVFTRYASIGAFHFDDHHIGPTGTYRRRVAERFSVLPIAWGEYIIRVRTVKGNGVGAGAAPFGFKGAGFEVEVG